MEEIFDKNIHEECGVFGVYGVPDAANLAYYGLHALQHRGQEGCGIVTVDDDRQVKVWSPKSSMRARWLPSKDLWLSDTSVIQLPEAVE